MASSLKDWNCNVFENIFRKKCQLWSRLEGVKRNLDVSPCIGLVKLEKKLSKELNVVLEQEQILWWQKPRANFLIDGDQNTRFFHISTIVQRKANKVTTLKDQAGNWMFDSSDLEHMALAYFENLYSGNNESPLISNVLCATTFPPIPKGRLNSLVCDVTGGEVWYSLLTSNQLNLKARTDSRLCFIRRIGI